MSRMRLRSPLAPFSSHPPPSDDLLKTLPPPCTHLQGSWRACRSRAHAFARLRVSFLLTLTMSGPPKFPLEHSISGGHGGFPFLMDRATKIRKGKEEEGGGGDEEEERGFREKRKRRGRPWGPREKGSTARTGKGRGKVARMPSTCFGPCCISSFLVVSFLSTSPFRDEGRPLCFGGGEAGKAGHRHGWSADEAYAMVIDRSTYWVRKTGGRDSGLVSWSLFISRGKKKTVKSWAVVGDD